jgi:aminoglycoside phosphotransferase family enzyme/predicted kinase
VFVGTDTVWKLRKAVTMTFLDFAPLAERERTARRELELNTQSAPGLYRDVVPITRTPSGLELDGPGDTVDWVVRMARIPKSDFLDVIAERGDLTPALLDALADGIAKLHLSLPPHHRNATSALRSTILGNHESAQDAGLPAARIDAWRDTMLALLDTHADWIARRGQNGFVRRTHGDLHLGNLCLWQNTPVPFDALEFSEAMATIDLGYDLAFLLMDLDIRAGRPAANRVLNRYVARTGDADLLTGLPLFLSMRALVRAHVAAKNNAGWTRYLAYAETALQPRPAIAIGIGGLPGSGKSTLARLIAPQLGPAPGALILRSDEIRKRQHNVPPEHRLPKSAYTEHASRQVKAELFAQMHQAAKAGHAVIADLTFMAQQDRTAAETAAHPLPFKGLWLQAPLDILDARIAQRTNDASDADTKVLREAAKKNPTSGTWHALDATGPPPLQMAMDVLLGTAGSEHR